MPPSPTSTAIRLIEHFATEHQERNPGRSGVYLSYKTKLKNCVEQTELCRVYIPYTLSGHFNEFKLRNKDDSVYFGLNIFNLIRPDNYQNIIKNTDIMTPLRHSYYEMHFIGGLFRRVYAHIYNRKMPIFMGYSWSCMSDQYRCLVNYMWYYLLLFSIIGV